MTYDRSRVDPDGWQSAGSTSSRHSRTVPAARSRDQRSTSGGGLFAPNSSDSRLRFAGIVLAAAGVLVVACSFLTWASASDDDLSLSVTGMGTVSFEASEARAQALGGSADVATELDERSKSPGIYTALFGALLVGAAILMVINRYPGIGAAAGAVLALIAVFMSLEYLFAPGDAVLDGTGSTGVGYAGVGLWSVTLGAFAALAASGYGTVIALRGRSRSTVPSATASRRSAPAAESTTSRRLPDATTRDRSAAPVRPHRGPAPEPRYQDRTDPDLPPSAPRPNFRPEPGYRARQGGGDGPMGRRPPPTQPGYRATPAPRRTSPHQYPTANPPAGNRDRAVPPRPAPPRSAPQGQVPPGRVVPPGQRRPPPQRRAPAPWDDDHE